MPYLPTKYNEEALAKAYRMCAVYGANEVMIAKMVGVTVLTITNWKKQHPEFKEVMELGKAMANANIANEWYKSCFDRTVWVEEERCTKGQIIKTKKQVFVPANPYLIQKWMAVREPENWSEAHRSSEVNNTTNINVLNAALDSLSIAELKQLTNVKIKPIAEDADEGE
jgi:hypothetical protein